MARDAYKYFRIEARELLDQLSRAALDLEKGTTPGLVAKLLRLAHTLKGAARVVRCSDIGDHAHAIEDALLPLRGSVQQATRAQIDVVLSYLDKISSCIAALSSPFSPSEQLPTGHVVSEEVLRTVRIHLDEMDALLDGFGEVHTQVGVLRDSFKKTEEIHQLMALLSTQLALRADRKVDAHGNRTNKGQVRATTEQLATSFDGLKRSFTSGIEQLDRELKQVRDTAERMRLIAVDSVFIALERVARNAAQIQNKHVVFEGRGGDVRLDAQVLGTVQSALSHVVRNAVVHGIEIPSARHAAGKAPEGKVILKVLQRGRLIEFICIDDGCGIDLNAVRRVAEQRGLLSAGTRMPDADTLLQLLLKGGISTLETATEVAGRGVGLDVVRDASQQLGGKVDLRTETGKGTTLTLTVPLSIASLDGLLVESSGVIVTIPIDAIRHTLRIAPDQISHNAKGGTVIYKAKAIPFLPLASVLANTVPLSRGNGTWSAVIVEADDRAVAIGVDRLLGATNVVLRPLPAFTPAAVIVAGVSLDVEGNPQLVLDPRGLVIEAQRERISRPASEDSRPMILVIDDSLTTRMLERSILESAGYEVELAVSGEDALQKASITHYALFLVDVEMPGMDGFAFIEKVKNNPKLRDIPAILVTSRASPEDLQRGRDVGASGHIVKSEFDQGILLAHIGELVRRPCQ